MDFKKSEETVIKCELQSGQIKPFIGSCYEFNPQERYVIFRNGGISDGAYVRIASMCIGQVFHFVRCDCYDQLSQALELIAGKENSVLIFALDQDGRAQGPLEHINAIKRMDELGGDTYEVLPDKRDYKNVAEILRNLGLSKLKLYTNNPDKTEALKHLGFDVEQISLETIVTAYNLRYMEQKRRHVHNLQLNGKENIG